MILLHVACRGGHEEPGLAAAQKVRAGGTGSISPPCPAPAAPFPFLLRWGGRVVAALDLDCNLTRALLSSGCAVAAAHNSTLPAFTLWRPFGGRSAGSRRPQGTPPGGLRAGSRLASALRVQAVVRACAMHVVTITRRAAPPAPTPGQVPELLLPFLQPACVAIEVRPEGTNTCAVGELLGAPCAP